MSQNIYKRDSITNVSVPEEILAYLLRELEKIEVSFSLSLPKEIEFLNVAPVKTYEGLTVGADGTNWNPGAGKGVYTYYSAAWNKLGSACSTYLRTQYDPCSLG